MSCGGHRRQAELHERANGREHHVIRRELPLEIGRRRHVHLDHGQLDPEARGGSGHLGAVPAHERRLLSSCQQLAEHPDTGEPRRAEQHDAST
jgi:hypothetical protein